MNSNTIGSGGGFLKLRKKNLLTITELDTLALQQTTIHGGSEERVIGEIEHVKEPEGLKIISDKAFDVTNTEAPDLQSDAFNREEWDFRVNYPHNETRVDAGHLV